MMDIRVFRLGFDCIRYNFSRTFRGNSFEYLFEGLSENSPQKLNVGFLGHSFTVTYNETKSERILNFNHGHYRVFCLVKNMGMGIADHVPYTFLFDGSYFYFEELSECLLQFTSQYLPFLSLSRVDTALDCNVPVLKLWKKHKTQFRKKIPYINGDDIESFYLGMKKGNKKYLIRVYDKKADSYKKEKFLLFSHYLQEETVTRIEAELHTKTIKQLGITPEIIIRYEESRINGDSQGLEILQQYFASLCMNERGTYFHPLKGLDFSKIERLTIAKKTGRMLHPEELAAAKLKHERIPHIKQFITRSETLFRMGIDPLQVLLLYSADQTPYPYWEQVRTHRAVFMLVPQLPLSPYEVLPLRS